ncbi:uncharacterized protein CTRU02_212795 [Colletotrichum truncatum]|uniref:Uncharacterized protein n=1 Tax=Colletotrichum truncatum TaxID=5467 RepID=A0ACC3YIZ0_COLTU|nr:uncharacterized protein CTRU02_03116 [Colletotrichum truncatum]KAF6797085.1 hypothetical protein CTRU02_03116 [Colletotrichum truncatum]
MSPAACRSPDASHPFKSRPDIVAPRLDITLRNGNLLSPGLYFLAPFKGYVSTPMIFDNNGDLVWSGSDAYAGTEGPGPHVYDFHTCNFEKSTHICMLRGFNDQGFARGQGIILDAHYQPVKHVSGSGVATSCDLHEFTTTESGETALITQYRRRLHDASRLAEGHGMIWLLEGVFQEIDIKSGRVLFEWRSLDHVDPTESLVRLTTGSRSNPWDYLHLNSVEKLPDGNYLVSGRHLSTVFKISSRDGSIIWRLGGKQSTFAGMDPAFVFQHQVKVLADDGKVTRLSMFDNARRPAFKPERPSKGLIIQLDHLSRTAQIEKQYSGPGVEYTAKIAGSTHVLPNDNVLVGFGDAGCFAEYTKDGTPGLKACIGDVSVGTLYRVYKSEWVGRPLNEVAIVSFSRTNTSSTAFYISWNGATEVKRWRVLGALDPDGPFSDVVHAPKKGFETTITTANHVAKAYVEALSATDEVLGKSAVVTTFVPSKAVVDQCDDLWCAEPRQCMAAAANAPSAPSTHQRTLGFSNDWQQIPFVQACLINLMVTLTLVLLLRYARGRSRIVSRIAGW